MFEIRNSNNDDDEIFSLLLSQKVVEYTIKHFVRTKKELMIESKILDEDDLHSNITYSMIQNLLVTIDQFSREIEKVKFNKLKGIIESRDEQSNESDVDFQSYTKSLLKYLNIENERLKIKISDWYCPHASEKQLARHPNKCWLPCLSRSYT